MGLHRVGHDWSDLAAAAAVYVYVNPKPPIHPLSFLVSIKFVLYICVSICFANKVICTIFLDSTYKWYYMILVFLILIYFTLYDCL